MLLSYSGVAKVGHMPHQLSVVLHQKYFLVKFENSNHDIIQANSNYILTIIPISLVSDGSMLDHKFRRYIIII